MVMEPLLGRATDIAALEGAWAKAIEGAPQLVVLWGRRRVGKTFLISHFIQEKPAVFFGATQQAEAVELRRFADSIGRDLGQETLDLAGGTFSSWEAALRFVAAIAQQRPLIVALDEVPFLA